LVEYFRVRRQAGTFIGGREGIYYQNEDKALATLSKEIKLQRNRPKALLNPLEFGVDLDREPLDWLVLQYFPSVPVRDRKAFPPKPLSHKFWVTHSEPFDDFLRQALDLRLCVELLGSKYRFKRDLETYFTDGCGRVWKTTLYDFQTDNAAWMSRYLESAGQMVVPTDDGSLTLKKQFPSLLSAFAQMAVEDILTDGHRLQECPSCHKPVVARSYQQKYCNQTCASRDRKRRTRRDAKRALEMWASGATLKEVLVEINAAPERQVENARITMEQLKDWLRKGNQNGKTSGQ
jgi:hypothetical protein